MAVNETADGYKARILSNPARWIKWTSTLVLEAQGKNHGMFSDVSDLVQTIADSIDLGIDVKEHLGADFLFVGHTPEELKQRQQQRPN